MNAIPSSYLNLINPLIEAARGFVESGDHLAPFAFIGNLSGGGTFPVILATGSTLEKDKSARAVKQLAELHQADFIFTIMEAWLLPPEHADHFNQIIKQFGSIAATPFRLDVVSLTLQTRHGLWAAQIPIEKLPSKSGRTFGEPDFHHFSSAEGRFADLLPICADGAGPTGTLH
ncbi:MAG TPA: hypothetical protein DDY14_16915 [Chromatiaceae bacterium]|nr:MAG: hypothetical protein N838_08770 [Thiohalocapsa sp. PB-PSB1]QQO52702.1 MAG: hypothetical protein N838_04250 [Thiohalocapsa sp. PB-PSB1]HBG96963.1 hypothetical protein [Chromatiaceae bacterium]HCS89508.1 hypothetical protein [Chromatiaceae bacterium]